MPQSRGSFQNEARTSWSDLALIACPLLVFIVSFTLGRYPVSLHQLLLSLASQLLPIRHTWSPTIDTVIYQVRLPRILAAMLVGAALSASGASYQGMFKNPMISGDILGVSSGAGFGAARAIYFSLSTIGIQAMAFGFGLAAVVLVMSVSGRIRRDQTLTLVLTGVIIGALFSAGTSLLKYVADPNNVLPAIEYWLMGSLASVDSQATLGAFIPIVLGVIPVYLLRWRINVLTLGDEEAAALGLDTRKLQNIVILCSTLMTSAAVSISGLIGWVGLIIPHLARMIVGPNYKRLLPASIMLGAAYLLLVDDVCRIMSNLEVPLGIVTAIIGAPLFLYLLLKGGRGWE